jgi:hypothetical protein
MSSTISTRRPGTSVEEKKAQSEALHNSISDQVELLRNSDRWAAFLNFARSFHDYSLNNLLLILSQKPEASHVAGFRTWQSLGRQVRKGEKAIRILGYNTKKITEEDENGDEVAKQVTRFPILSVFDITQTDLIDGAPDTSTITAQLTGTDDSGIHRPPHQLPARGRLDRPTSPHPRDEERSHRSRQNDGRTERRTQRRTHETGRGIARCVWCSRRDCGHPGVHGPAMGRSVGSEASGPGHGAPAALRCGERRVRERILVVGTPKTHERRSVPYPQFLSAPLADACVGKRRDDLVFDDGHGGYQKTPTMAVNSWWDQALAKADLPHMTRWPTDFTQSRFQVWAKCGQIAPRRKKRRPAKGRRSQCLPGL